MTDRFIPEKDLLSIVQGRADNKSAIEALGINLSEEERDFAEYYLQVWNVQKAAVMCGAAEPDADIKEARIIGNRLLRKPDINAIIQHRLDESVMSSKEVLARFSEQARGDITMFLKEDENVADVPFRMVWDWNAIKNYGYLIKKMKQTRYGLEIELYSAQDALTMMGKHHQLFADVHKIDATLTVQALAAWREHASAQTIDVDSLPEYNEEEQRDQVDIITIDKEGNISETKNTQS